MNPHANRCGPWPVRLVIERDRKAPPTRPLWRRILYRLAGWA